EVTLMPNDMTLPSAKAILPSADKSIITAPIKHSHTTDRGTVRGNHPFCADDHNNIAYRSFCWYQHRPLIRFLFHPHSLPTLSKLCVLREHTLLNPTSLVSRR